MKEYICTLTAAVANISEERYQNRNSIILLIYFLSICLYGLDAEVKFLKFRLSMVLCKVV